MESHTSVFLGIVDVLGYSAVEQHVDSFQPDSAAALLNNVYTSLDQITIRNVRKPITCIRYGDGYVLHSETQDIEQLASLVKGLSKVIALASCQYIPLRVAITQGDIKVIHSEANGLSITGSGWNQLIELEKALNWMGGWLYLPNYDGKHHPTVSKLVSTTNLIKQQINCDTPGYTFTPPFKVPNKYQSDRAWFLNWHKVLHQPNDANNTLIDNWWNTIPGFKNTSLEVQTKQNSTKEFAWYCDQVYQSAKLIFHSGVNSDIDIGKISSLD